MKRSHPTSFLLLTLSLSWILTACTEQTEVSPQARLPVLEGYLTANGRFQVRIFPQVKYDDNSAPLTTRFDTLHPLITDNEGTQIPLTYAGDSLYVSDATQLVRAGKTYYFKVKIAGLVVMASTTVPELPRDLALSATTLEVPDFSGGFSGGIPDFPDPIDVTWTGSNTDYYLVMAQCLETNRELIFDNGDDNTRPVFRTEPVQASGLQIGFQSFTYLGRHRIVLVRTTADYAALFRESSNSSQSLVNPSTTILNAYGIFTGLSTDTTYLKVTN